MQWPTEKVKQRSTKHIHKSKDRVTRTPLKTGGEPRCPGRVDNSCSISGTRHVNLVTNRCILLKNYYSRSFNYREFRHSQNILPYEIHNFYIISSCKVCKHEFRNPQTKGVSSNHEYCFSRK